MKYNDNQVNIIKDTPSKKIYLDTYNSVIYKIYPNHNNVEVYQYLRHNPSPFIPKIYAINELELGYEIMEEYIDAPLLSSTISLDNHNVFDVLLDIGNAIKHLHSLNIVHRDIKPDNIMITETKAILIDYDISKIVINNSFRSRDTQLLGSIGYASPEHYGFKTSDKRSDIYSFGKTIKDIVDYNSTLTQKQRKSFQKVINTCTQIDPNQRYQSINEVMHEILKIKNNKSYYTLPGYRSNVLYKKVIASIAYPVIIFMIIIVESEGSTTLLEDILAKITLLIFVIPIWWVSTNYLNVKRILPYKLRKIPILGSLLLMSTFFMAGIILFLIISSIIQSML